MTIKSMVILGFIKSIIGAILITIMFIFMYGIMIDKGFFKAANYQEMVTYEIKSKIQQGNFDKDNLPEGYTYALFDKNNTLIESNIKKKYMGNAKFALKNDESFSSELIGKTGFKTFDISDGKIVIAYEIKSRYTLPILNKILPSPEYFFIIIPFVAISFMFWIVAKQISLKLKKGVDQLIESADKVGKQDLSFELTDSRVYEINLLNNAFINMSNALENSLSEQWKMEEERKSQISAVAHDIKTPLMLIYGHADLLLEMEELSKKQKEHINLISKGSEQISNLVKIMLEASEIGYQLRANREKISILNFNTQIYDKVKGICDLKHIKLLYNIENNIKESLFLDINLVERSMLNIVQNAIEFTPENGEISVTMKSCSEYFIFEVHDGGKGFSQKDLINSKNQFYRGDNSRKMDGHYGLGLYIAEKSAKLHGGELVIENHPEGGGIVRLIIRSH